jgi:trans-aconitate methyltransferase
VDQGDHHAPFDSPEAVARLEREAEGLTALWTAALDTVEANLVGATDRVVDVGCGPGVVACLLAQRFRDARVVAADGSPAMVEQATARAARLGLGGRVEARHVPIPEGLDHLDAADVVWASMVLHHVDDAAGAVQRLGDLLRPGGVLALVEKEQEAARFRDLLADAGLALRSDEALGEGRRLLVASKPA